MMYRLFIFVVAVVAVVAVIAIVAIVAMFACRANATDRIEIPSSFNPVGSGARAMGLGGSFIAMADDATAASWNPAALMKLREVELALVYTHTRRIEDDQFAAAPEASGKQKANDSDVNYLAFSVPCSVEDCGKNMVFSLNYQRLYELSRSRQWQIHIQDQAVDLQSNIDYQQTGALYALGAAYAVQLTADLFVGVTLNFWQDFIEKNQWQQEYVGDYVGFQDGFATTEHERYNSHYQFEGFNYNLGLLWEIFEQNEQKLTLGLVYKSDFTAELTKTISYQNQLTFAESPESNLDIDTGPLKTAQQLDMPQSFGIGVAYQWSDSFTTSIDFYRSWWSDFILTDTDGSKLSPLDSGPIENSAISDTTQIRLGAEYRLISQQYGRNYIIPIRGGLFVDPAAAGQGNENSYGLALGGGIAFEHFVFDIAYQYRFGNDIGRSTITNLGLSQDIDEHMVLASVFYRF